LINHSPKEQYHLDLENNILMPDPSQAKAIDILQRLYDDLTMTAPQSWWQRLFICKPAPLGLYLWGGVGRGKTYLIDVFFDTLPFHTKLRSHFHHFMNDVHDELKRLKGTSDPLIQLAKNYSKRYRIICFDEFFVSDIADAMILGTLIKALMERGVVFVATSNIEPDDLYKNGLQRARFLPVIEQIKTHCDVYHLDSTTDYRLRMLEQAEIYHSPLDAKAHEQLHAYFHTLSHDVLLTKNPIDIHGRSVEVLLRTEDIVLINFKQMCDKPRSHRDYIEIAQMFHTVLLDEVAQMGAQLTGDDVARRFIAMIDEFYERNVKLIMAAAVPIESLYQEGNLSFEFKRCISRIVEMQSFHYLALEHRP
jgi:cell division protein ZapE